MSEIRVSYQEMKEEFKRILLDRGFEFKEAIAAADIFAKNSLDGVYSHGYLRFPVAVSYIDSGVINPLLKATKEMESGAMERWNGQRGFGPLNAKLAMDRACELAKEYGIGLIALGNNNHWMRGGSYGIQAADLGYIGICWSNTMPNMPAWGAVDRRIGNNPLVMGIPKEDGNHIVIDCAMSQFSYGKLEVNRLAGKQLPVPGGYDEDGNLTTDPASIEKTWRVLPMGYWKGSGLSIALDLIATILTAGNSVGTIGTFSEEVGLSQVMIAIDPNKFNTQKETESIVQQIISDLKESIPEKEDSSILFPNERGMTTRKENLKHGIPVVEEIWNKIKHL